jgi:DNA-directed RNA polymerase specialized sigma subunit
VNDKLFPQYEYTQEMFNEDKKIARIVFHFRFKWLFQDSINYNHPCSYGLLTKDDFIHIAIIALMRFRPKFNPDKAKYSTIGRKVARRAMNQLLFSKKAKYTNKYLSMDKTLFEDEDDDDALTTYENTLHNKPIDWSNIMYYECVIDTAINTDFYKGNTRHIACMFAVGYKQVDIAKYLNVSEAYISKVVKNYIAIASDIFPYEDEVHNFYITHFTENMEQFDVFYLEILETSIDDLIIKRDGC